jgi:hypothetical protein
LPGAAHVQSRPLLPSPLGRSGNRLDIDRQETSSIANAKADLSLVIKSNNLKPANKEESSHIEQ